MSGLRFVIYSTCVYWRLMASREERHPDGPAGVRPEGREPLPDKAGQSTLLSRSGGSKGLRGSGAGKPRCSCRGRPGCRGTLWVASITSQPSAQTLTPGAESSPKGPSVPSERHLASGVFISSSFAQWTVWVWSALSFLLRSLGPSESPSLRASSSLPHLQSVITCVSPKLLSHCSAQNILLWPRPQNPAPYCPSPKSLQIVIAVTKLKDTHSLEGKLWQT